MWLKLLLGTLFALSLLGAFVIKPHPKCGLIVTSSGDDAINSRGRTSQDSAHLRLMTWNIGNDDLESDTRAHSEDLPAVAQVILDNDADAVAIQELTGADQLQLLLSHLNDRYRGYACRSGGADRVDGVLVKNSIGESETGARRDRGRRADRSVRFSDLPAGDRFAAAATFRLHTDPADIVLVSAHADAFSALRRRVFAADVVDWARSRAKSEIVFIAGDLNFEVTSRKETNLFTDDAKHDSETYAYFLKYFRDLGRDAGDTSINDRRIDYIFGAPETVSLRRAEVLRGAAIGRMDHWPLLVEATFYGVR